MGLARGNTARPGPPGAAHAAPPPLGQPAELGLDAPVGDEPVGHGGVHGLADEAAVAAGPQVHQRAQRVGHGNPGAQGPHRFGHVLRAVDRDARLAGSPGQRHGDFGLGHRGTDPPEPSGGAVRGQRVTSARQHGGQRGLLPRPRRPPQPEHAVEDGFPHPGSQPGLDGVLVLPGRQGLGPGDQPVLVLEDLGHRVIGHAPGFQPGGTSTPPHPFSAPPPRPQRGRGAKNEGGGRYGGSRIRGWCNGSTPAFGAGRWRFESSPPSELAGGARKES